MVVPACFLERCQVSREKLVFHANAASSDYSIRATTNDPNEDSSGIWVGLGNLVPLIDRFCRRNTSRQGANTPRVTQRLGVWGNYRLGRFLLVSLTLSKAPAVLVFFIAFYRRTSVSNVGHPQDPINS